MHFHCYLLRSTDGRLVLVDTGIGPKDSPAAVWAPVPEHSSGAVGSGTHIPQHGRCCSDLNSPCSAAIYEAVIFC